MFIVFYTVILYISVFVTCSTSYSLYDTLMDPWNVCIYKYIYVQMYVRMSECTETEFKNKFLEK